MVEKRFGQCSIPIPANGERLQSRLPEYLQTFYEDDEIEALYIHSSDAQRFLVKEKDGLLIEWWFCKFDREWRYEIMQETSVS